VGGCDEMPDIASDEIEIFRIYMQSYKDQMNWPLFKQKYLNGEFDDERDDE